MITVLLILHLMIAASLVGVVLLQKSEGGALGIGGGGGFMTVWGAANFLTRVAAGLAAAFVAASAADPARRPHGRPPSVFDAPPTVPAKSAPAVPGPEAPAGQPRPQPAQPGPPRGGVLGRLHRRRRAAARAPVAVDFILSSGIRASEYPG